MSFFKTFPRKFSGKWNIEETIRMVKGDSENSFYLCNLSDVVKKYDDWIKKIPRVKPFYAVKCNDDVEVLKTLASIGCSFDCASEGEISKIISLNVDPSKIIFANTTKPKDHIEYAKENKVNLMTFDNEDEVYKIAKVHPCSDLVLRIRYCSDKAKYKLGKKFGCDPAVESFELLKLAQQHGLNVVGISFHIGSGCEDYDTYCEAIKVSRHIFDVAHQNGFRFHILDLGGGFPGDNFDRIDEFAGKLNNALDENFPLEKFPQLQIISEPGRYFVASAFTLISLIHSRKVAKKSDGEIQRVMYYLNEGIYSNFLFIPLGPESVEPQIMNDKQSDKKFNSTLWGPTCDSTDVICKDIEMELLEIGDVIYFKCMGAYTIPTRTPFNGLNETKILHFINLDDCKRLDSDLFEVNSQNNLSSFFKKFSSWFSFY